MMHGQKDIKLSQCILRLEFFKFITRLFTCVYKHFSPRGAAAQREPWPRHS